MTEPETCARCGHQTPTCPRCERTDPFLGAGTSGDQRYCHTFSPGHPTCYETVAGRS